MTFKKTLALVLVAGFTATTGAHAIADTKKGSGFYLAADLGYSHTRLKFSEKQYLAAKERNKIKLGSFDQLLSAGWMGEMNNFLYGVEAGIGHAGGTHEFKTINIDGRGHSHSVKFSRGMTYDVIGKLGMKFGKSAVYALGGISWSKFKAQEGGDYNAAQGDKNGAIKKTSSGPTYGAGYMFNFSDRFAIRTEYRHTDFKKINANKVATAHTLNVKPKTDAYTIGLVWNV